MFGIGLPEMIVIFAVALLVVGPEKLPELARSLAKGLFELKRTVNEVKGSFAEEEQAVNEVKDNLKNAAAELQKRVLLEENPPPPPWQNAARQQAASDSEARAGEPEAQADAEAILEAQAEAGKGAASPELVIDAELVAEAAAQPPADEPDKAKARQA
ncbi:twin-arginine translocase TatA/TatE family subunit [Desulfobulbus oralis]|uniref:Sec-independent protein translocase protein TatB homolog n=1 Tax=Desulfobulbus oralis TaxID=1986146 RepID=A0A2L1GQT4_9BACT|nr:twin-arginine translocase TatA/TatE family subunit [Desulfobulbus oralis]AVD72043.1 hypothetical protein CAY53_11620 [Desulfobulbus oralis]